MAVAVPTTMRTMTEQKVGGADDMSEEVISAFVDLHRSGVVSKLAWRISQLLNLRLSRPDEEDRDILCQPLFST